MEHMTVKPLQADRRTGRLQPAPMHVPERVLWSYACQLASLLRVVHAAGLAARCIEPSKVLRTAQHRIRLNGCAVFDVLGFQPQAPADALLMQQRDDLAAVGRLLLCVACNNVAAGQTAEASLGTMRRSYSAELLAFITRLVAPERLGIDEVVTALAPRFADELGSALNHADLLEAALMRELENGRLVRLLCKLNAVNERPECVACRRMADAGLTATRSGPRRATATLSSFSATLCSTRSTSRAAPCSISATC